jgi:hypothetical protein
VLGVEEISLASGPAQSLEVKTMKRFPVLVFLLLLIVVTACGGPAEETVEIPTTSAGADGSSPASETRDTTEKLGEWAEKDDMALVARAVDDPANPDTTAYEPRSGTRLVAVQVELGAFAAGRQADPHLAKLIDANGRTYEMVSGAMADYEQLVVKRLSAGERVQGWIAFELPEGAQPAYLEYGFTGYVTVATLRAGLSQ